MYLRIWFTRDVVDVKKIGVIHPFLRKYLRKAVKKEYVNIDNNYEIYTKLPKASGWPMPNSHLPFEDVFRGLG